MKALATTTQMEATSGYAVQRRSSYTPSASRAASPETHEEADIHFNPPTYTDNPDLAQLSEKEYSESHREQLQRHFSNPIPDTHFPVNNTFPQCNVETSILHQEEPRCDILLNRPAAWLVRSKGLKISSLAAIVLLNDGILTPKDLTLFQDSFSFSAVDQGPSDPISGVLTATHRTVVGVLGGVVDYPVAISRIATSDLASSKRHAASFALDSGKGISRIVGTGLKAPMEYTLGISQGFHNVPKLWGDKTVRDAEPVTGVRSGFKAAGKGFGLGLYDGISGLVTQPVKGAQEGGVTGFVGGFFKGIGGVACKPAAGVAGLPAYAFKGFYEEFQKKRGINIKSSITAGQMQQGWEEFASCTAEERTQVRQRWYHFENVASQNGFKVQTV